MNMPPRMPPAAILMQLIAGHTVTQAIAVSVELGIINRLKDGPNGVATLAKATETHAPSLKRLLRALATAGVVVEHEHDVYSLSPIGQMLREDVNESFAALARLPASPWYERAYDHLIGAIRTGKSGFSQAHGEEIWTWLDAHPAEATAFHQAASSFTSVTSPAVIGAYDFSNVTKLVDVGGGHGAFVAAVLKSKPNLNGILFDRPSSMFGAKKLVRDAGVETRCEVVEGDFFKSVPAGGDLYVLKQVLHHFDDDQAAKILTSCVTAMGEGGKVVVIEQMLPPAGMPSAAKVMDLDTLVLSGAGRERTEPEMGQLFAKAGLRVGRMVPTQSPLFIIEAVKA
jgi:hypothetical protein